MRGPNPLDGKYIFGDIHNGRIFAVDTDDMAFTGPVATDKIDEILLSHDGETKSMLQLVRESVPSASRVDLRFGQGPNGELYVLSKPVMNRYNILFTHRLTKTWEDQNLVPLRRKANSEGESQIDTFLTIPANDNHVVRASRVYSARNEREADDAMGDFDPKWIDDELFELRASAQAD